MCGRGGASDIKGTVHLLLMDLRRRVDDNGETCLKIHPL